MGRLSILGAVLIAAAAILGSSGALDQTRPAEANGSTLYVEQGVPSTGFNRVKGGVIWNFPHLAQYEPFLGPDVVSAGFENVGAYDPSVGEGQGNSRTLTPDTPDSAIAATHLDADGLSVMGLDPTTVPDSVLNLPIDDVAVLVDPTGVQRVRIPCATDVNDPTAIVRAGPCHELLTLDDWLDATGNARIKCRANGTAQMNMKVSNLRPNRLYSVWMLVETFNPSAPAELMRPIPMGGVPNSFVTDKKGKAVFKRELGFCPHQEERVLGWVVAFRSDGQTHGGVPVPFINQQVPSAAFDGYQGLIPGTTIHVQLSFNVGGVEVD